ncbi:MAG: adenylate cyclase [Flavobacteriaceae bacterium]|jgi:adenylate cyclase
MNKKKRLLLIIILVFISINSYLFLTAPEPLNEVSNEERYTFSVNDGFKVIAGLNDEYRAYYTKKIVGDGKKSGLNFDEDWLNNKVEAGPLPALFLRSTSAFLEKSPIPLGLYLGSDFPISKSNLLTGIQKKKFEEIKQDKQPKFFFDKETNTNLAMFADIASANACVSCHNNHKDSPKKDWKLNDIMGATTWSYPVDSLTTNELISWINGYNQAVKNTYSSYLDKTKKFKHFEQPVIGKKWPSDGYFLPSLNVFSDTVLNKVSTSLIKVFIDENK